MPQFVLTAPVDRNVLTIPSTALVFQEHGTQVAVVTEDDRVHFKPITVSRLLDNAVEVAEGISASDRIVNNPSAALLEGDKVRIVTPAPGYDLIDRQRLVQQRNLSECDQMKARAQSESAARVTSSPCSPLRHDAASQTVRAMTGHFAPTSWLVAKLRLALLVIFNLPACNWFPAVDLAPTYEPPQFVVPASWHGSSPFVEAKPSDDRIATGLVEAL